MVETSGDITLRTPGAEQTDQDPVQIQEDIEQTRAEMSQTIDAIQDRLSPDALKQQAKDKVKEATIGKVQDTVSNATQTVSDAVSSVTDAVTGRHPSRDTGDYMRYKGSGLVGTIKENPIPVALIGVGVGWLLKRASNRNVGSQPYYYRPERGTIGWGEPRSPLFTEGYRQHERYTPPMQYGQYQQTQYSSYDTSRRQGDTEGFAASVQDAAGTVQERAGQMTQQVGQMAGQVGEQVGQVAGQVGEQVGQLPGMARTQADEVRYWYRRQINESPMMLGVAAIGVGALAGLLLPETERESQLMGEKRDELVDRAQTMAQETVQKVQAVAEDVGANVQQTVQQSAQEQGLTSS
jgi:hypothetical protein